VPKQGSQEAFKVSKSRKGFSAPIAINCKPGQLRIAFLLGSLKKSGACTYNQAKTHTAIAARKGL